MKILFQSRSTLFSVPGGDTIQIMKTAEALRTRGVQVDISTDLEPDLSDYDMVHLFNLMRPQEVYLQASNARRQGRKVALSTVYGHYTEYERQARRGIAGLLARRIRHTRLEYLKVLARAVVNREVNKGTGVLLTRGYRALQEEIIRLSDVFLPNSHSEMERVQNDFPAATSKPHAVVPNAIDARLFDMEKVIPRSDMEKYEGCVLSVARIEGRKCQLDIVRAMRDLPWPLVLVGRPAPNHRSYYEQIQKEAGPNVHIRGQVGHDQLPQFYRVARVHCLVSWMETPGLSSLEAGAMGCNLVITEKGDTRDYFGDRAFYCEPGSIPSIRAAIIKAHEAPVDPGLRDLIMHTYTWEIAAQKTYDAYSSVL